VPGQIGPVPGRAGLGPLDNYTAGRRVAVYQVRV